MRRVQAWLAEMSLVQQLLTVIMMSVIVFFLLFFVYLRSNIQEIADRQSYDMLHRWQSLIVTEYRNGVRQFDNYDQSLINVSHVIFVNGRQVDYIGTYLDGTDFTEVFQQLNQPVDHMVADGRFPYNKTNVYYSLTSVNSYTQILSIVDESYATVLQSELFDSVSNLAAIVVGSIFILLFLWVSSLLHPLNQIRTYIERIRNGEEAKLSIERNDEIGEVAFALVNMREELKRQDEIKEEMIHNISHDLKTPIATIKSYGESIKDGIYPYGTLDKSVDVIIENATRLEKKVHSLLFLNRLDYLLSTQERDIRDIPMKELVDHVLLSLIVIRPEIEITTQLEPTVFRGDEESWRVLVENLIDNALRYAKTHIHIVLKEGYFSVSNDGPCLSQDRMDKLFRPFEKGAKGKFGLGLSICYKVANAYGYMISAMNIESGVQFEVRDKTPAPVNKKDRRKRSKEKEVG